jgi:glycosyltransferase involved in cell wall biosynthesis
LLDHPLIEWLGEVDEPTKRDLMVHALALLLPIDWPEPFGMVFIEALACGSPVLTRPIGSAPELLRDGVTGYSSMDTDALVAAAKDVHRISRWGCRMYAKQRFDTHLMASQYIDIYQQLLENTHRRLPWAELPEVGHASADTAFEAYP